MKQGRWLFLFILVVIYFSFKAGDFEIFLENNQDKFAKEVSMVNNIIDVNKVEKKYKKLVSDYILEKKTKDKNYTYEQFKLNSFLRKIHKNAYTQKEKIRQKICEQSYKQIREFSIDANNRNITLLYFEEEKLVRHNCKELTSARNLIHDKVAALLKSLSSTYKDKLKSIETLDELYEFENIYKSLFNKVKKQLENKEIPLVDNYYTDFINSINAKKKNIQRYMCTLIINEVKDYAATATSTSSKLNIDSIKSIVFQFNQFNNAIVENNCTQEQTKTLIVEKDKTLQQLRERIIIVFTNSLEIEALSTQYKKTLENEKSVLQKNAEDIAKEYGKEMAGLHPIIRCQELGNRDKKIAEEYLINPFKHATKEFTLKIGSHINNVTLDFIKEVYENYIDFCETYELHCQIENDAFSFIKPYKVFEFSSGLTNDYEEEGLIWNTLDEALSWVPILGDAKEFLDINICKDEDGNTYEAKKDLMQKIADTTATIKQNIDVYRNDLMQQLYQKLVSHIILSEDQ